MAAVVVVVIRGRRKRGRHLMVGRLGMRLGKFEGKGGLRLGSFFFLILLTCCFLLPSWVFENLPGEGERQ